MSSVDDAPGTRKPRRFRNFLIILLLVAAAFAGGFIWGEMRLRQASAAWKADQQKLEAALAGNAKTLDALKATQSLWEVDGYVSEVLADLADSNFGLARDAANAAILGLARATPGLTPAQSSTLAPLEGILKDLGQGATSASPDVKARAREARSLIRAALKAGP
jgi:hypothetical protein